MANTTNRSEIINRVSHIIRYDASRPYFGDLKYRDLYDEQAKMRRMAHDVPNDSKLVKIGEINGDVICNALWQQMRYNPGRFNIENPFLHNGKNNIYNFVANKTALDNLSDTCRQQIISVSNYLYEYLSLNAHASGQWNDRIQTENGYVRTVLRNGQYTGETYKKLKALRLALQEIINQNVEDLKHRTGPYFMSIIRSVISMYPEQFQDLDLSAFYPIASVAYRAPVIIHFPTTEDKYTYIDTDTADDNNAITQDLAQHGYLSGVELFEDGTPVLKGSVEPAVWTQSKTKTR